jgi:Putative zincin peptidase
MNLTVEELEKEGYVPFQTLKHTEIGPFIKPYLSKRNRYVVFYAIFSLLPLLGAGLWFGYQLGKGSFDSDGLTHFFYGFTLAFLLMPLHEFLHGLAYQYVGAKNVSYGAQWRKFVFYALADRFVADRREFRIVALTPFVVITFVALLMAFFVPIEWKYTCVGLVFVHSSFCGGDFGLLSFYAENADKQMVTYDDVPNKVSYFFVKK